MDLEEALARIADLEGQVTALSGERDAATERVTELTAAQAVLDGRLAETAAAHDTASANLAEAQLALSAASGRELSYLRRALLAEQAGQIVPELVGGEDETALLASVEVAKQAYTRAVDAARVTIAHRTVPAGAPSARTTPADGLSPLEMIESGLRK